MAETMLLLRFPDSLSDKVRHAIAEQTKRHVRQQQLLQKQQQQLVQQHGQHGGKHLENNDKLLDHINIEVLPDDNVSSNNNYTFVFGDESYPALLVNMPTIIETHKTFDKKTFFKSGDIGEALLVFLTEKDREIARSKNVKTLAGEYYANGLTGASYDIVNKRFLKTQQNSKIIDDTSYIREVMEDIAVGWELTEDGKEVREFIEEEVVDFEDWMATPDDPYGISVVLKGKDVWNKPEAKVVLENPQILAVSVEQEEEKAGKKEPVPLSSSSSTNLASQSMEVDDDVSDVNITEPIEQDDDAEKDEDININNDNDVDINDDDEDADDAWMNEI